MNQSLPIECPKCVAQSDEPCVTVTGHPLEAVHNERDLANQQRIYEKVKGSLDAKTVENVDSLREKYDAGNKYCGYGHDLYGAIRRAHYNDAFDAAEALMDNEWIGGRLGLAISRLIDVAARRGDDADRIRRTLERVAARDDSTSIEKSVERYSGKTIAEAKERR